MRRLSPVSPRPGAPPHAVHEPGWDPQLGVWENPRVLGRAFVVHHAIVLPDDAAPKSHAVTVTAPKTQLATGTAAHG